VNPRARLAAVAPLLLYCACGGGGGGGAATATPTHALLTSGIDADTVEGPTCPVQQQGQMCTKPFAATVVVTRADGGVAARISTSSDGRAHIPLPPGTYTVGGEATAHGGLPRPEAAKTVAVPAGQFVSVQISFDTGIR
jgi:hypothetical protein